MFVGDFLEFFGEWWCLLRNFGGFFWRMVVFVGECSYVLENFGGYFGIMLVVVG